MFHFLTLAVVLSIQLVIAVGSQSFFSLNAPRYKDSSNPHRNSNDHPHADWGVSYDAELYTPLEDFSSLSENGFTTFGHPAFPRHSIRIKKTTSDFCDETVK